MRHWPTIASAAAALRQGRTSSIELVEASLDTIARENVWTNAFILVDGDGARRAARDADDARQRGVDRGPLDGIPISVKDLIDVAKQPTTAASLALDGRLPRSDAPVITRLRAAGAVILGKTNLHEFALGTTSEDSAWGPVRHPLDTSRAAGGSSGGSAVAVARGMGLASVGTDTGGSIRIPAAACGVVGLKPTAGEVPTEGVVPLSSSLDHVGPLAGSVQDAAWLWSALSGRPPLTLPRTLPASLRLARLTGYFDSPCESAVRTAFELACRALSSAGVAIRDLDLPGCAAIRPLYGDIVLPEAAHWHAPLLATRGHAYTPRVRERIESGRDVSAVRYLAAQDGRLALRGIVDAAFADADVLILPTLPIVAPPLGVDDILLGDNAAELFPVRMLMLKHTQLFNVTGHPAVSIPVPASGLPVGLQLVGRRGRTADLLAAALACETILAT